MNFDWHMLYPLHTVILDNSRDFRGVPCRAQLCNFSKWFFSPRFGVVPIWELWQFWYVRKGPPKTGRASGLRLVRGGAEGPGGLGGEPQEAPRSWARAPEGGRSLRGGGVAPCPGDVGGPS